MDDAPKESQKVVDIFRYPATIKEKTVNIPFFKINFGNLKSIKMVIPLMKFIIYGGAIYIILASVLHLSSTQLIAFSGLLGAAIGFGLKDFFWRT